MILRIALVAVIALPLFAAPALAADPVLDQLFNRLGETTDRQEAARVEAAITRALAKSGSATADLLLERGTTAMNKGDYDAALDSFNKVITLAPDFVEGWNHRATLHFLMGRLNASIDDINRTLALEPRHFGALAGLGQIYIIMGRPTDATRAFQRALAADPYLTSARQFLDALKKQAGEVAL